MDTDNRGTVENAGRQVMLPAPIRLAVEGWQLPGKRTVEPRWDLAFIGIAAYIIIEYTRLPAMFPVLMPFRVAKIAAAIAAVGLILSPSIPISNRRYTRLAFGFLFAFLLVTLVCSLTAVSTAVAMEQLWDTARWTILAYLIARIIATPWRTRVVIALMLLLNFKLAQFAIRSYFSLGAMGLTETYLARGIGAGITGFFANSNDFGTAMCIVWPLCGSLLFAKSGKISRSLLLMCFLVIFGAILVSGSRGAFLGIVATAFAAWVRNPKRLIAPLMIVVIVVGGFLIMPEANQERVLSALNYRYDENAQIRIRLWKAGVQMFFGNPIFGVGPNNYRVVRLNDAVFHPEGVVWEADPRHEGQMVAGERNFVPHSIYIQALAELGLFGTMPLVGLWVAFFRMNRFTRKRLLDIGKTAKSYEYCASVGLDLSMIAFLTSGAFLTILYYPHLWILVGLGIGLHTAALNMHPEVESRNRLSRPGWEEASRGSALPAYLTGVGSS